MKSLAVILCVIGVSQAKAVWSIPVKYQDPGLQIPVTVTESRFPDSLLQSRAFVDAKRAEWKACHQRKVLFAEGVDPLAQFLETGSFLNRLEDMEKKNLLQGRVSRQPWSGDYWAYSRGILGARFRDPGFERIFDWKTRFDYIQKNPVSEVLQNSGAVNVLSPAEKYDLIVGSEQGSLAASQWAQGREYFERNGKVEDWMGICHGWAPAAIMEPRPQSTVQVMSLDQKWKIQLTPGEVKGLTSYSWATNQFPAMILGRRCNEKNPKSDANGRLIAPECFDLNPGTWHQSVVNLIGVQDRSFVLDATFDYEVWNQPVLGYSYTYFNPLTGEETRDLKSATISRGKFKKDRFAQYRSSQAASFVGVKMKLGYVVETSPSDDLTDSEDSDVVRWVEYQYDLEISKEGRIIGGEWYTAAHPDFIWTPRKNVRPSSPMDSFGSDADDWQPDQPVPVKWAEAARRGAPRGLILNRITESLLNQATAPAR